MTAITLSDLYMICMIILGILSLYIQVKKKQPPFPVQKIGDCFSDSRGLTVYRQRLYNVHYMQKTKQSQAF